MKIMPSWYLAVLNFAIRRVVACGFVGVGMLLTVLNLQYLQPGATIDFNGQPSNDLFIRFVSVGFPALVAFFGVLLFRAKPIGGTHG